MSIEKRIVSLRQRQEEIERLFKYGHIKLEKNKLQQKEKEKRLKQLAKKRSKLGIKIYQEEKEMLEAQIQGDVETEAMLKQLEKEYSANEEEIKAYLSTSFKIELVDIPIKGRIAILRERQNDLKRLIQEGLEELKGGIPQSQVDEIIATIGKLREECASNEKTIGNYLEDTSFYIEEQVQYLVEAFINYVKEHETELGYNIKTEFQIYPLKKTIQLECGSTINVANGNMRITKLKQDKLPENILVTRDYYFEKEAEVVVKDTYNNVFCVQEQKWYSEYQRSFVGALDDALVKQFKSKNFKLTVNGWFFTLELI